MQRLKKNTLAIIKAALREDIGRGDITSRLIIPPRKRIRATIVAKQAGVGCGLEVARLAFAAVDPNIRFHSVVKDGKKVAAGKVLARLEGEARSILQAERVALNFLSRLSGIASLTNKYVQLVKPYRAKIMDTRKTTPGLRLLEKYAVRCGGGVNHRMGLWDQVLIKDNHLAVFRIPYSVFRKKTLSEMIKNVKQKKPKGMKIEVEVRNLQEFKQALLAKPDIIMLDNFDLKSIRKAVRLKRQKPEYRSQMLEASGGVGLDNLRKIAASGVEMISVGELTHSAKALDIALNCE